MLRCVTGSSEQNRCFRLSSAGAPRPEHGLLLEQFSTGADASLVLASASKRLLWEIAGLRARWRRLSHHAHMLFVFCSSGLDGHEESYLGERPALLPDSGPECVAVQSTKAREDIPSHPGRRCAYTIQCIA